MNVADRSVLVVGGGTMGVGITQTLLRAGCRVTLSEADEAAGASAVARLKQGLDSGGWADAMERLDLVVGLKRHGGDVDLAVEAVPEDEALKHRVLAAIEACVDEKALVASNTSSISIGGLARALRRPERFVGMHFFNPVPRSSLVEIVTGPATGAATVEAARGWVQALDKEQIVVRDSPGFATSRLGLAVGLEAIRMAQEGVATAEDIDKGMVLGYRFPIGPLRLTDLVGLDVRLAIADYLAGTLGDRFSPPQLLRDKVAAGELGKKTGKGFFTWT